MDVLKFLPVSRADMAARGWDGYDFLLVTGDAYVDHPSFGTPLIGRLLEREGYRVALLSQPEWRDGKAFKAMGRPRLGAMLSAGNLDSMVARYTAAKKTRAEDFYSPAKKAGLRPDRASIVYSNRLKEAFPGLPVVIGGLEASLRRFAHYDYWDDKVRRSALVDSKADLLVYGMGERATLEIAARLRDGEDVSALRDVRGTAFLASSRDACAFPNVECPSCEAVREDKAEYARAAMLEYSEHDPVRGRALIQKHGDRYLIVNPPAMPLDTEELDSLSRLPFTRCWHPMYDSVGGVPAIEEVRFSVIHNRGCFGSCNFCSLTFHQGRIVTSRSHESVLEEIRGFLSHPEFKGYVHDIGGPTANFRRPACKNQLRVGACANRSCLTPKPCPNLDADHSDYLKLLREAAAIPGVKKVFVRSGVRYDYMLQDKSGEFFAELVKNHVSGQLKVAPEHCVDSVLDCMGKPHIEVYEKFLEKYRGLNKRYGKEQFVVPYLMSSHPGCTLKDAIALAEYLHRAGRMPEQVQDFYPTPGTLSTCMYYTGLDPRTMKPVFVARGFHDKALQRAMLQWARPDKRRLVLEALRAAGRDDLIGFGPGCLVRPESGKFTPRTANDGKKRPGGPKKPLPGAKKRQN